MKCRSARAPTRSPQKRHVIDAYMAGREEYKAAWMLLLDKLGQAVPTWDELVAGGIVQNGEVGFVVDPVMSLCRLIRPSDVRIGRAIDWPTYGAIMTVEQAVEVTGQTPNPLHVIDGQVGVLIYEDGGAFVSPNDPRLATV
jgi:hypothetical protein